MLSRTIKRIIEETVEQTAAKVIDEKIVECLREIAVRNEKLSGKLTFDGFGWQMAFDLIRSGMDVISSRGLAFRTLRDFLKSEGIKFGDAGYGWSQADAVTLIQEWEIAYWDDAPAPHGRKG